MALSLKFSGSLLTRLANNSSRKYVQLSKTRLLHGVTAPVPSSGSDDKRIVKSKVHVDAVTGVTLPEFVWSNLHKWSKAPAFECGVSGRKYTYEQLYMLSRNFGAALMQHGLKRPDVVGILLPNIPEFPLSVLGTWEAGLTVTTVNPLYKPAEIAKQMNDSGAKVLITLSQFAPLALAVQKMSPSLKSIITIGEPVDGCHSLMEMVKVNSNGVEFDKGSKIDTTKEIAFLPYSSGTTGPPKGVMLTHSNICSNIHQMTQPGYVTTKFFEGGAEQERLLAILPYFHIFGFTAIMFTGLYQGLFTMTLPKFEPATFIEAIRKHKPTCLHLVPPLIAFMAGSPDISKKEFESVHSVMGGAAPIGEALISKLLQKAEKYFFFQEGYGMTELSPVSHILPGSTENKKIGSVGILLPGTTCKIVDPSTGNMVGPNQRGEICFKGPQVMNGYFNNEKATEETFDKDGWLRTGDVGMYDEDECFYIVDRIKELIKVKGLQVAPSELEDILRSHPDVADVAVIGIPDERAGELPRAYVVRNRDGLSESDVKAFVAQKVSDFKQLNGGVEFIAEIPKAASGKILRRELKDAFLSKAT